MSFSKVLTRIQAASNANLLATFDIVAVRPTDTGSFTYASLTLSSPSPSAIDIISIDFAAHARLPFQLKRSAVLKAVADGVVFEVAYSPALRTDPKDARRNILAGARELIRITSGKGIIFSSDARTFLEVRSPADVQNLCVVRTCRSAFIRASIRMTDERSVTS